MIGTAYMATQHLLVQILQFDLQPPAHPVNTLLRITTQNELLQPEVCQYRTRRDNGKASAQLVTVDC